MIGYKVFYIDKNGLYSSPIEDSHTYFKVGGLYTVDTCPIPRLRGFHFCKNLLDLIKYKPILPSYPIHKVEAEGEIVNDGTLYCCTQIKILDRIPYEQFISIYNQYIEPYKDCNENVINSKAVSESTNVYNSSAIYCSLNIDSSSAITSSECIENSKNIFVSRYIRNSSLINSSKYVESSDLINSSLGVVNSYRISNSINVSESSNVDFSSFIFNSFNIRDSLGIFKCSNLKNSIFCCLIDDSENMLFNKKVSADRIKEIYDNLQDLIKNSILLFNKNNIGDEGLYLNTFPTHSLKVFNREDCYMSNIKIIEYISKLEEYDNDLFLIITGIPFGGTYERV